jgi:hypothetical protein
MRAWIARRAHEGLGHSIARMAIEEWLLMFERLARIDRDNRGVDLRVAENEGAVWVDIADDSRGWVEVANAGWRGLDEVPVPLRPPDAKLPPHRSERSHTVDAKQPFLTTSDANETGEYEANIADATAERTQTQTVAGSEADVCASGADGTSQHRRPRGISGRTGLADGLAEPRQVEALPDCLDGNETFITKGHGR